MAKQFLTLMVMSAAISSWRQNAYYYSFYLFFKQEFCCTPLARSEIEGYKILKRRLPKIYFCEKVESLGTACSWEG